MDGHLFNEQKKIACKMIDTKVKVEAERSLFSIF